MKFTISPHPQRSAAWLVARCGHLTGSRARAVLAVGRHGESLMRAAYRHQLVSERYTGVPVADGFVSAAMRRGLDQEPAAVRAYEAEMGARVMRTGFLVHPTVRAGCSLDGSVDDFDGILEIKNPNSATHLRTIQDGRLPARHRAQVTHNLWISGARYCDFVSFDDRCPSEARLLIVRVYATELDLAGYDAQAVAFLAEVEAELVAVRRMVAQRGPVRAA